MVMNFIDSVARGWAGGGVWVGEEGGKTNPYTLFGVAMRSGSIHTEPR